jgi:hypothetical protein
MVFGYNISKDRNRSLTSKLLLDASSVHSMSRIMTICKGARAFTHDVEAHTQCFSQQGTLFHGLWEAGRVEKASRSSARFDSLTQATETTDDSESFFVCEEPKSASPFAIP